MNENALPPWTNQDLVLFHGTTLVAAKAILAGEIKVSFGRRFTDFGPGFYTTTVERQARNWARRVSALRLDSEEAALPAVIELIVNRDAVARLETLAFANGEYEADAFWSFVHSCRQGATNHGRAVGRAYYDLVIGPVAAFWEQKAALLNADQVSFHTEAAELLLNSEVRRRMIVL